MEKILEIETNDSCQVLKIPEILTKYNLTQATSFLTLNIYRNFFYGKFITKFGIEKYKQNSTFYDFQLVNNKFDLVGKYVTKVKNH